MNVPIVTNQTRSSFNNAVREALEMSEDMKTQPAIFADIKDGELWFRAVNMFAWQSTGSGNEVHWSDVRDVFDGLTGDHQADADGIEANNYEQAVEDNLNVYRGMDEWFDTFGGDDCEYADDDYSYCDDYDPDPIDYEHLD